MIPDSIFYLYIMSGIIENIKRKLRNLWTRHPISFISWSGPLPPHQSPDQRNEKWNCISLVLRLADSHTARRRRKGLIRTGSRLRTNWSVITQSFVARLSCFPFFLFYFLFLRGQDCLCHHCVACVAWSWASRKKKEWERKESLC